jgi:hypothetical protein
MCACVLNFPVSIPIAVAHNLLVGRHVFPLEQAASSCIGVRYLSADTCSGSSSCQTSGEFHDVAQHIQSGLPTKYRHVFTYPELRGNILSPCSVLDVTILLEAGPRHWRPSCWSYS